MGKMSSLKRLETSDDLGGDDTGGNEVKRLKKHCNII